MMTLLCVLGLGLGVFLGWVFPYYIASEYTVFMAVALLAALDSVFGGLNANAKKKFRFDVFATGFFFNTVVAAALTYFGKLLSLDLYLAAVVVFGTRIFQNIAELRRMLLKSNGKSDKFNT